jgi:hypothetical protein
MLYILYIYTLQDFFHRIKTHTPHYIHRTFRTILLSSLREENVHELLHLLIVTSASFLPVLSLVLGSLAKKFVKATINFVISLTDLPATVQDELAR